MAEAWPPRPSPASLRQVAQVRQAAQAVPRVGRAAPAVTELPHDSCEKRSKERKSQGLPHVLMDNDQIVLVEDQVAWLLAAEGPRNLQRN